MKKRVQVRDLEAPERIQPAPVQSDTYAKPAPPPINNNLEQLAKGLGVFASAMTSLGRKHAAEEEQRIKLQQLADYEQWKASVSSDEHLDAIRSGSLPINVDKILDSVVKKDSAELEAGKLASEIDADIPQAGLGSQGFDADAYVRQKAAPYVSRLSGDPRTMAYFGGQLDRIRAGVLKRHEDVRGQLQTQYLEDRGKQEIGRAILSGADQKMTPQQIMDQLRDPKSGIYAAIGPRNKKGSLDLAYGRMDELTIDMLDSLAEDPRYATTAVGILFANRTSNEGHDIGPLAGVHKHGAKVEAIVKKARKTVGDYAEKSFKEAVLAANIDDFDKGRLGFAAIRDQKLVNPGDPTRVMEYSATKQRDDAITAWLDQRRAIKGRDIDAEAAHFSDMGIKHPELEKLFDEAYKGFLSANTSRPGAPDKIPDIIRLGDEYTKIAERNWSYAKDLVSADAREFFETYRVLRQLAGWSPEVAAQATAIAFSKPASASDPHVLAGNLRKLNDALDDLDAKPWWPGGTVINSGAVRAELIPLAKALSRVEGLKAEDVITKSAQLIVERSAFVNGRLVISPTLSKGDGEYVQPYFDRIYKEHGPALREHYQVKDAKHLSLIPAGPGHFIVSKWDGPPVSVPVYDENGQPIGTMPLRLSTDDIVKLKLAGKAKAAQDAAKAAEEWRKSLLPPLDPGTKGVDKDELDKRREQLKRVRRGEKP